jgi:hypothetical protein
MMVIFTSWHCIIRLNDHILKVGERKNMEAMFLFLLISIRSQDSIVGAVTRLHARPARV